jgi:hypothetical protein
LLVLEKDLVLEKYQGNRATGQQGATLQQIPIVLVVKCIKRKKERKKEN